MKKLRLMPWVMLLFSAGTITAQTDSPKIWQATQVNVHIGFALPQLYDGVELLRARDIREGQQSYFQNDAGQTKSVGEYSSLAGITFGIAFYKPIKRIERLMAGARLLNTQTGSEPAEGGYPEGYYFNFLLGGVALKYYPLPNRNFFFNGDVGIASVFTKNRFVNSAGEQNFLHQFGIGVGFNAGVGYDFALFKNKQKAITLNMSYQYMSTRVEVDGVGDDQWRFGSFNLIAAYTF